jgi:hypothetical protein
VVTWSARCGKIQDIRQLNFQNWGLSTYTHNRSKYKSEANQNLFKVYQSGFDKNCYKKENIKFHDADETNTSSLMA